MKKMKENDLKPCFVGFLQVITPPQYNPLQRDCRGCDKKTTVLNRFSFIFFILWQGTRICEETGRMPRPHVSQRGNTYHDISRKSCILPITILVGSNVDQYCALILLLDLVLLQLV